jgi:hypothetical protein
MSEARMKLQARKDAVDITKIGLQGGVYGGFTTIDVRSLEDAVVRYGVAQALLDGLASTEEGLAVRDILPDLDFRLPQDATGLTILKRQWIQPVSGTWDVAGHTQNEVYSTTKNSNNDQKVIVIYGIRCVSTGVARTGSRLFTSSVIFRRAAVKTIDIWQIESLDVVPDQTIYGRTPLLFKKGDNLRIDFILKATAAQGILSNSGSTANLTAGISGYNDTLMFLGKTIEKIGDNVTG